MKLYIFSLIGSNGKTFNLTFNNIDQETIDYLNTEYSDYKRTFIESIEVGKIIDLKPKEVEKTYYLIGGDATTEYNENGIEGVAKEYEADELTISVFCFIEGETKSHELAEALEGWDDYVIISEEEFILIN